MTDEAKSIDYTDCGSNHHCGECNDTTDCEFLLVFRKRLQNRLNGVIEQEKTNDRKSMGNTK